MVLLYEFPMGNYEIVVPMNVRCEGTIVLYHRNSIRDNTVGVFHFHLYILLTKDLCDYKGRYWGIAKR